MLAAVIVLGVLFLALMGLFVFFLLRKNAPTDDNASLMIKQDITQLTANVGKLNDELKKQLAQGLDKNQASMSRQLDSSSKLVKDVTERLTKLDETNRRVVDVADELKQLQNVLQNPKQRGVLGEFYLEQILQNLLPPNAYTLQYKIAEGYVVDAVIHMDGKVLPIDSKFSLENYNRLVDAKTAERPALERAFKEDLKRRIDETSKYIQPRKNTLDLAMMFIPSEAIYYDLLANKVGATGVSGRDLMQYAAVDKRVTIVGPSTLSAMLQMVGHGLKSLEIQKDTDVIRKNIEQLQKHLVAYDGYFKRVGASLGTTVGHYNNASKELGKVDKDIIRIGGGESVIETEVIIKPNDGGDDG